LGSAISAYNTGLESDPTNTDILHNKASVLNRLGRLDDAHACQERIHALQNPLLVETKSPEEEQQQIIHDSPVSIPWNKKVLQNLKKFDPLALCLSIFGLPLVLTVIYLLPDSLKENMFFLEVNDPHLMQIFLANFVHTSLPHLESSIMVFIVCLLVIQMFESRKRVFLLSFLIFISILPIFIEYCSSANILANFPEIVYSYGASGIVAAFIGYAMLSLILFVYEKNNKTYRDYFYILWLIIASFVIMVMISQYTKVEGGMIDGLSHFYGFIAGMVIPFIIRLIEPAIPTIKVPFITSLPKTKSVTIEPIIGLVTPTGSQSTQDYLNKILVETDIADKPTDT